MKQAHIMLDESLGIKYSAYSFPIRANRTR